MRITLTLILALLLALVVTIFAIQNNAPIDISFLAWKIHGSLALVLMITFALGILIGLLVSTPGSIKKRRQFVELRKNLRILEKDLEEAFKPTAVAPEGKPVMETTPEEKPEDKVNQESEPSDLSQQ